MNKITTAITEIKTTVSMEQWQQRIMECQQSGMSIKAWCQENGVATSSYYHYLRKIRAVFSENTALHEENSALKDEVSVLKERLAWFEKQVYGQKSEKSEVMQISSRVSRQTNAKSKPL